MDKKNIYPPEVFNIMDNISYKNKIRKALKKKDDEDLLKYLSYFSDEEKYNIMCDNIFTKLKYFTPSSFRIFFPLIREENKISLIRYLLTEKRFDLANILLEFGWTPDKELIEEYEKDYKISLESNKDDSSDNSDITSDELERILEWLKPNNKL